MYGFSLKDEFQHSAGTSFWTLMTQKSVFCYRTPDFVNGPFVALDHIFDLAPSDRFLNFSFPSYGVSPSGLRPENLHFFTLHPYNPYPEVTLGTIQFSVGGHFFVDRNQQFFYYSPHFIAPIFLGSDRHFFYFHVCIK